MSNYDLVVVGSGTGAQGVAHRCRSAGWRVAIVDSFPYGGTCALRGCDPKKMLVGATEALDWVRRMHGKGLRADGMGIDWAELMAFKRTFTDVMPDRVTGRLQKAGVDTFHGAAAFIDQNTLQVGDHQFRAKHFHLATGARRRTLGIPGEEHLTTSTQFLELESLPKRIVFVGGGFISFEFAHIAARSGATVTILQQGKRALINFDPDLVDLQCERTRELGVDLQLEAKVCKVVPSGDALSILASTPRGERTFDADLVVHGAGRAPAIEGLQLDRANVAYSARGIAVNEYMQSVSNPAVYAAGDCADTKGPPLTPVASYEGRVAAKNLLEGNQTKVAYPPIPTAVFTIPPITAVGLHEAEANEQGLHFDVRFKKTAHWYSSMRVAEPYSAFKVLVEKPSGRVLGAHVMGLNAEEIINLFSMAMKTGMTANEIKATMFAYPSYASDIGYMV